MALVATSNGNGEDFATLSTGAHFARLVGVIDLGTQTSAPEYGSKQQHKVQLQWEILGDEKRNDGRPFTISKTYTVSLHEKASLRKDIEAWIGKVDGDRFEIAGLLGKNCQLSIVHAESDGKTYANIAAIMAVPKGMPLPTGELPLVIFDLDQRDMAVFDALPERLQEKIKAAPEWTAGPTATAPFADELG